MHRTLAGRHRALPCLLAVIGAVLGACADAPAAPAPTSAPRRDAVVADDPLTVTTTADAGIGSLRWVMKHADSGQVIRFAPTLAGQTIAIDSTIYIEEPVTIEGPAGGITIDGQDKARVFYYAQRGVFRLRDLSITRANSGNSVGGAIGGGSANPGNAVVLEHTTLHDNRGAAAVAVSADSLAVVNSTISGNTSTNGFSAHYGALIARVILLDNSTVAHNATGGVGYDASRVTLRNAVLAGNEGRNCVAPPSYTTREGANVSDDDACGGPGELLIADPKLGALAPNGGPARTHALLAGSPAIDAGVGCTVAVDQRYMARDARCDLGAFEFADFTTVTVTSDAAASVSVANGWAVLTGTVRCSRPERLDLAVRLAQPQKAGRTQATVSAQAVVPVECATTPRPWTASLVPAGATFEAGDADATVETQGAEPWVTPASATRTVKLFRARK